MKQHDWSSGSLKMASVILFWALFLTGGALVVAQSRIPAEPANYLQVVSQLADGARDRVQTVFFEVPDTLTGTLYFAIRNPGNDNTAPNTRAALLNTTYYLKGGFGAYTSADARKDYYTDGEVGSSTHLTGTTLGVYRWNGATAVNVAPYTTPAHSTEWVYFPGVDVSEGEKVANKYYFRVVIEHEAGASTNKNAFQLGASLSNTSFSQPSGVGSFAYSWNLGLMQNPAQTWNLYPFVPDSAVGSVVFWNFDMDNGETNNGYNIVPVLATANGSGDTAPGVGSAGAGNVRRSGDGGTDPATNGSWTEFTLDGSPSTVGGTWTLTVTETNGGEPAINTSEFWFTDSTAQNGGSLFRAYSSYFVPPAPDFVALSLQDGQAKSDGVDTETVTLQLVDAGGSPVPYVRSVFASVSGSALIDGGTSTALLTTNGDGMVTLTLTNTVSETVSLTLETDGAPGASALDSDLTNASPNETAQVVFSPLTPPTASSTANSTLDVSTASSALPDLVITEVEAGNITTANEVWVRLPSTLTDSSFSNVVVSGVVTGTGTVGPITRDSQGGTNNVLRIPVTLNFDAGDLLTLSNLQLDTGAVEGFGRLEISFDGGATYLLQNNRVVTVTDTSANTWWGTLSTNWQTAGNWSLGAVPTVGQTVVIPPTVNQPALGANTPLLASVTLQTGSTLNTAGFTLNTSVLNNQGTLNGVTSWGSPQIGGTVNTGGGNLTFTSPLTLISDTSVNSGGGSITFQAAATVNGAFSLTTSSGAGNQFFQSLIGNTTPPVSLTVDGSGTATVSASQILAGNTVTYNAPFSTSTNLTIQETLGSIIFNSTVTINGATLTLDAGEIDFNGGSDSVTGTGAAHLVLQELGQDEDIDLGGAGDTPGQLDLTSGDLGALAVSLTTVTVNSTAGALSWVATATLKAPTTLTGNLILAAGNLVLGPGAAALTVTGTTTVEATTTVGGATTTGAINLQNVVLDDAVTLSLGNAGASAITAVTLNNTTTPNSSSVTINTTGAVTISGAVGGTQPLNILAVTHSGGLQFQGTVAADTLNIVDTTDAQTLAFLDNLTVTGAMTISNGGADNYHVSLTGTTNSIAGATAFNNGGNLTLGNGVGDTTSFVGGLDTTAVGGTVSVAGSLTSPDDNLALGNVTMTTNVSLDSDANGDGVDGNLTLGVVRGAFVLTLDADTGTVTLGGTAAANPTGLSSTSSAFNLTGAATVAGPVNVSADTVSLGFALNAGTAAVTLQPVSDATTLGLNDAAGTFNLTAAELNLISTTGLVTLGRGTGTGAVSVGSQGTINLSGRAWSGLTLLGSSSDVSFNFTIPGDNLRIPNNTTLTLNTGGAVTSPGSSSADVTIGGTGILDLQNVTTVGSAVNPLTASAATLRMAASGDAYLSHTGAVQLGDATRTVSSSGGLLNLSATGTITVNETVSTAGVGTLTLTTGANLVMDTTSLIQSGGGAVLLDASGSAGGSLTLDVVEAGAAGALTLRSGASGTITRADATGLIGAAGSTSVLDINDLAAGASVGATLTPLRTDVGVLRAAATGAVNVSEASDLLLGDATRPVNVGGAFNLAAGGDVSTGAAVTGAGGVDLDAGGGTPVVTLNHDVTTTNSLVRFRDNVAIGDLGVDISTGAALGNILFDGTLTGVENLGLTAGTGSVTFTGAVGTLVTPFGSGVGDALTLVSSASVTFSSTGHFAGSVSLSADDLIVTADLTPVPADAYTLTVSPSTVGRNIGLGNVQAGTLNVSAAEFLLLDNGWSSLTLGRVDGTGDINLGASVTVADPLILRSGAAGGSFTSTVGSNLVGTGNASLSLQISDGIGDKINLGGNLTTQGQTLSLGAELLTAAPSVLLDTTTGGNPGGADITLSGGANDDAAGGSDRTLTLSRGTGLLSLGSALGATTPFLVLEIRADDLALTANLHAQTVRLYTAGGTASLGLGGAAGGFNLSDTEVGRLRYTGTAVSTGLILGESGVQAGAITLQSVAPDVGSLNARVTINSNLGAGAIVLDDTGGAALATGGSGPLDLLAGTGGITASNATNATAELSTTGIVTLTSAGVIGGAANRIQFPAAQDEVDVMNAPGGVWLDGLGTLSLGSAGVNQATGNGPLNVTTQAGGHLILNRPWTTGTGGAVTLTPAGEIRPSFAGTLFTVINADVSWNSPTVLYANTALNLSENDANNYTFTLASTLDGDTTGTRSFTLDANGERVDIAITGATGAAATGTLLALTLRGNDLSLGNLGTGGQAGVSGATALTAQTAGADTGVLTFTGTNYHANQMVFTAPVGSSFVMAAGSATSFTNSADDLTFTTGTLLLNNGSDLTLGTSGGTVSLLGGVRGTSSEDLTVNSGAGSLALGAVGNTDEINTVTLTSSHLTGVTLSGDVVTSAAPGNTITITGNLTLAANVSLSTRSGAYDDALNNNISITGTVRSNGTTRTLLLDASAGGGNVTLSGVVGAGGAGTELASLDLQGNDISLVNVGTAVLSGVIGTTNVVTVDANGGLDTGSITWAGTNYRTTGAQTWNSGAAGSLTLAGGALGSVTSFLTAGGALGFTGEVLLNGRDLTVNTANGVPAGANIVFDQALTGGGTGTEDVSLTGGTGGFVNLTGGGSLLRTFTVNASTLLTRLGANLSTANVASNAVTFSSPLQITDDVTLTTQNGPVNFTALDEDDNGGVAAGTHSLDIAAGTGDVVFTGNVGSTKAIGSLTIVGGAVTLGGRVTTANSGNLDITHSSTLTISDTTSAADTATADILLDGSFTSNGAGVTVSLTGDITTAGGDIHFYRPVFLTGDVRLSTGAGAGDILFENIAVLNGEQNFILEAGVGEIHFGTAPADGNGRIGQANAPLSLTIESATDVHFRGIVRIGTGGMDLTAQDITFYRNVSTLLGGNVTITNAGTLTLQDPAPLTLTDWTLTGDFTQDGAGPVDLAADFSMAGQDFSMAGPGVISQDWVLTAAAANFDSDVESFDSTQSLTIDATGGQVVFGGSLGLTTPLTTVLVTSSTLQFQGASYRTAGLQTYNVSGEVLFALTGSGTMEADSGVPGNHDVLFNNSEVFFDSDGELLTFNMPTGLRAESFTLYRGTLNLAGRRLTTVGDLVLFGILYDEHDAGRTLSAPANTFFRYPQQALLLSDPGTYNGALTLPLGSTLAVGRNFYANGINLTSGANWNLQLAAAITASSPAAALPGDYDTTWNFGERYAAAFNLSVSRSQASGAWVSAAEGVTDSLNNAQWDFTRPTITSAETVYDNLIRVTFSEAVLNTNNELLGIVGVATPADRIRLSSSGASRGDTPFTGVFTDALATTSVAGQGNLSVIYLQVNTATWNTDADGTGPGDAASTNRSGATQTSIPELSLLKGRIWDAQAKNLVTNYGENAAARFTATTDEARPVLVEAELGRHTPGTDPTFYTSYDGHNYYQLTYSEPVSFTGAQATATAVAQNVRATLGFGDAAGAGTVAVAGLFSYPGTLSRDSNDVDPVTNSLYRDASVNTSDAHGIRIYLSGFSTGAGAATTWLGFHWDVTDPNGQTITVPSNAGIVDLSPDANAVEPTSDLYAKPGVTLTEASAWDWQPPIIAPYDVTNLTDVGEVVIIDSDSNEIVDLIEFNFLDNESEGPTWDSFTSHPRANTTRVLRDNTFNHLAFSFRLSGSAEAFTNANNTGFVTEVSGGFFIQGGPPSINITDDGYVRIQLTGIGYDWTPVSELELIYDETVGKTTDLAGNLLRTIPIGSPIKTIEKTPPTIALTLTGVGMDRVYVEFSEVIRPLAGVLTNPALFELKDSAGVPIPPLTLSITSVEPLFDAGQTDRTSKVFLNLSAPMTGERLLTFKVSPAPSQILDNPGNVMDDSVLSPISNLGINMVTPLWASDGFGGEENVSGTARVIRTFTGSEALTDRDVELQSLITGLGVYDNTFSLSLFYDVSPPLGVLNRSGGFWLPRFLTSKVPQMMPPAANNDARALGTSRIIAPGFLRNFLIPASDGEIQNGKTVEFLFQLGTLLCVTTTDPTDPRTISLWRIPIRGVKEQVGGVTVLNNVINPGLGQLAQVNYSMKRSGIATIQIFALDGSLVRVLHRGRQALGDYTLYWDGKNQNGRTVARGMYFVRVTAPDIDEIRNVLVIKD